MADHDGTNRGQFLTLSTVGLGAMIGGVIGVPATAYLLAPVVKEIDFSPVMLGKVSDFPSASGGFKPVAATYVEDPKNPDTSAGLAWVYNTGKQGTTWNAADAQFIVFSNRCMHLGCPVLATLNGFSCPCHGGQYNTAGQRIAGPPIRSLDRFQWEIRKNTELWITQRWATDFDSSGHIHYYEVKGPGQPVTVPFGGTTVANILYPPVTYKYPAGG
ncbi:MAG: ubiquinol-cytochrome c reductase iron-sulfur subunit [Gaiellales bacterium]